MSNFISTDNLFLWNTSCLLLLFSMLSALIVCLYIKILKQQKEILALKNKLVSAQYDISELTDEKVAKQKFTDSLTSAEVTTKLQVPRLQLKNQATPKVPEKYRYLVNMARSGMSRNEITDILDISSIEAEQLIKLVQIAA